MARMRGNTLLAACALAAALPASAQVPGDSTIAVQWAASIARAAFVFTGVVESAVGAGGERTVVIRVRPDTDAVYLRPADSRPLRGARLTVRNVDPALTGTTVLLFATLLEIRPSPVLRAGRVVPAAPGMLPGDMDAGIGAARLELKRAQIAAAVRASTTVVLGTVESTVPGVPTSRPSGQDDRSRRPWFSASVEIGRIFKGSAGRRVRVIYRADERFRRPLAAGDRLILMLSRNAGSGGQPSFLLRDDSFIAAPADSAFVTSAASAGRGRTP